MRPEVSKQAMRTPRKLLSIVVATAAAMTLIAPNDAAGARFQNQLLALLQAGATPENPTTPPTSTAQPVVAIETSKGPIKVQLFPQQAPKTVKNFLQYVDNQFYDDTIFHRVISGFVIQGGGFTPELTLKPTLPPVEMEANTLKNDRGSVALARSEDPNSATAQFFINLAGNERLDRSSSQFGYTVFGRVIEGMEVVDRISRVQTSRRGSLDDIPILPVFIDSIRRVEEDHP